MTTIELDKVYNEDCLEGMKRIPDGSVDMILCDLPYGTTTCKWDTIIPFEPLWEQYERVIKDNGAIVLFGRNPFFAKLIMSNESLYRYEIIWDKKAGTDFAQANRKPITVHENIGVFYKQTPKYNRIDDTGFKPYTDKRTVKESSELGARGLTKRIPIESKTTRTPTTIRTVFPDNRKGKGSSLHPTQKPVELIKWLVEAYSNEGETILDNCMGSGTTAIAALNTNRHFIGFELDKGYWEIANQRIEDTKTATEILPDRLHQSATEILPDPVNHPNHYNVGGIETIDIIRTMLTPEEFQGYCKGNVLKYRERAEHKGNPEEDYAKARKYMEFLKESCQ